MFKTLKKDIDKALALFLKDLSKEERFRPCQGMIYEGIKDFVERDGKRIRPALLVIGYEGYTRRRKYDRSKLLRTSLAMELLHDFLLVHDDVIDNSTLRRGKPTLHKVYNSKLRLRHDDDTGPALSIVAGDIIFALAVDALLTIDERPSRKMAALKGLTGAAADTGVGEFIDVVNNVRPINNVPYDEIMLTYIMKTAKYTFSSPLVTGATLAGISGRELDALTSFGIFLGQAFQIQDDLLDIFSTSEQTGKPVLSDLNESKKTLLVWHTHNTLKGERRAEFSRLLKKKDKKKSDLLRLRSLISISGAGEYCLEICDSFFAGALEICHSLRMKDKQLSMLENLIDRLSARSFSLKV